MQIRSVAEFSHLSASGRYVLLRADPTGLGPDMPIRLNLTLRNITYLRAKEKNGMQHALSSSEGHGSSHGRLKFRGKKCERKRQAAANHPLFVPGPECLVDCLDFWPVPRPHTPLLRTSTFDMFFLFYSLRTSWPLTSTKQVSPANPDVPENLKRLQAAGFRMVTLTNSSSTAVRLSSKMRALTQYCEKSISVDSVHRFKPDLEVYRSAAAHPGVKPTELRLIAAHARDVFGATKAGCHAAFVGPDIQAVTDALLSN